MSFPRGTMPTTDTVHPAALCEAIGAFLIAALLWRLRTPTSPTTQFALLAILIGTARFLVEFMRLNATVAGLTAAQLFSLALVATGVALLSASS